MALRPETLTHYRRLLSQRREELAKEASRAEVQARRVQDGDLREADDLTPLDVQGDAVDLTNSELDRAALLDLAERDSQELRQVEAALAAIDGGTYGICAECGEEIPQARLDAIPRATLCIRHQEALEGRLRQQFGTGGALSRVGA